MKLVGDHLANIAGDKADVQEYDLFCRSAFNRYYYSAFLSIRIVLRKLDPRWATPNHQDAPSILTGEVLRRLKRHIKTAQSNGVISELAGDRMMRVASTAASTASNLLTAARETRRLADYEPETKVIRQGRTAILGHSTLADASNWERKVETSSKTILKIYGDLGVI